VTRSRAAVVLLILSVASTAFAEAPEEPTSPRRAEGRWSFFLGGGRIDDHSLGSRSADLDANIPGVATFPLFNTRSAIRAATPLEARVGFRPLPYLGVEAAVSKASRQLATRLSADFEGANTTLVSTPFDELRLEGSLLAHLRFASFLDDRVVPLVRVGYGYLRDSRDSLEETGDYFVAAAGLMIALWRPDAGWLKALAFRGEARLEWRDGGFELGERSRTTVGSVVIGVTLSF